jgi:hypothetical protein
LIFNYQVTNLPSYQILCRKQCLCSEIQLEPSGNVGATT